MRTSPVFRMLLMSSRKDSSFSCESLNRNTVGLARPPELFKTCVCVCVCVCVRERERESLCVCAVQYAVAVSAAANSG